MTIPFVPALVLGAGLLALWIDVRLPRLAPESLSRRLVVAGVALAVLQLAPVLRGSSVSAYATVFGIMLPVLVATFLAAVWLLRSLRDAQIAGA